MGDDFESTGDPLRRLWQWSGAFQDKERFFDQLQAYKDAGWLFW